MSKTLIRMNRLVYLGLPIVDLNETVMFQFWYDYEKPKYDENYEFFYKTDSFIVHVKMEDIYKDIEQDIDARFDTSNFQLDRPLPKGKDKKVIGLMKDELGGQITNEFVGLTAKKYSYLKKTLMKIQTQKAQKSAS